MTTIDPTTRYQALCEEARIVYDSAQAACLPALTRTAAALREHQQRSWLKKLLRKEPVKGLYLWGSVGRGKTLLFDLMDECLSTHNKKRLHFYAFMQTVHHELTKQRLQKNPLQRVAKQISSETDILLLDEFMVNDVVDALILAELFQHLFAADVCLITTSNIAPENLYHNGVHRDRFLPAIALIKKHTDVLHLDNGIDYRLRTLESAELYYTPLTTVNEQALADRFTALSCRPANNNKNVLINERELTVNAVIDDVIWFDFAELCEQATGQYDYLEIAKCYHTLILSNIPQFDDKQTNPLRRFISLIDVLYDHKVKFICSASTTIENLYLDKKWDFIFARTQSRLQEMQSHAYLACEHITLAKTKLTLT